MPADDAEVLCSNLIMNALQHSLPPGRVSATVQAHDGVTELRVKDEGEGIPEAALPHVFERFYRADRSRSRNSGGAGLGLSICKAIVERSNGTIQIQSTVGTRHRSHSDPARQLAQTDSERASEISLAFTCRQARR